MIEDSVDIQHKTDDLLLKLFYRITCWSKFGGEVVTKCLEVYMGLEQPLLTLFQVLEYRIYQEEYLLQNLKKCSVNDMEIIMKQVMRSEVLFRPMKKF